MDDLSPDKQPTVDTALLLDSFNIPETLPRKDLEALIAANLPPLNLHFVTRKNSSPESLILLASTELSIRLYGILSPIYLSRDLEIIHGGGRYSICQKMRNENIDITPTIIISDIDPAALRASLILTNKNFDTNQLAAKIAQLHFEPILKLTLKRRKREKVVGLPEGKKASEILNMLYPGSNKTYIEWAWKIFKYDKKNKTNYLEWVLDKKATLKQILTIIKSPDPSFAAFMEIEMAKTETSCLVKKGDVDEEKVKNLFDKCSKLYDKTTKKTAVKKAKGNSVASMASGENMPSGNDPVLSDKKPNQGKNFDWVNIPKHDFVNITFGNPSVDTARAVALRLQEDNILTDSCSLIMTGDETLQQKISQVIYENIRKAQKTKVLNVEISKSDITGIVDQSETLDYPDDLKDIFQVTPAWDYSQNTPASNFLI